MKKCKARALQQGDTIGIISPSWGGAGVFPHRVEQGKTMLEQLGFKVKFAEHARNHQGYLSDSAENRASDIHQMFLDDEVKAIIAAVGGDHSCHLLPLLDYEMIAQHPKIFMGYSDVTVLNMALWKQCELVTFNGPAFIVDFAEYPQMLDYTLEHFLKTTTQSHAVGTIQPANAWTEEMLDWAEKEDLTRARAMNPSTGWHWLKAGGETVVEGRLLGGCLGSLQHLRGTPYWPDWQDSIFFVETSEEKPSPAKVDGILMDYENMGVLSQIKGMLVGRPMYYSEEEKQQLDALLLERTQNYDFPIISTMDFGHTAPQFCLPLGCKAQIDSKAKTFGLLEAAVS